MYAYLEFQFALDYGCELNPSEPISGYEEIQEVILHLHAFSVKIPNFEAMNRRRPRTLHSCQTGASCKRRES